MTLALFLSAVPVVTLAAYEIARAIVRKIVRKWGVAV